MTEVLDPPQAATLVSTLVPSSCPLPILKTAIDAWKAGRLNGEGLCEASYAASLDILDEFRYRQMPTVPQDVIDFRRLSFEERSKWKDDVKARFTSKHSAFFEQEAEIAGLNNSNFRWLNELLVWLKGKQSPAVGKIKSLLFAWNDMDME